MNLKGCPIPLDFLGFRSDTYSLQRAGWQIAEEFDRYSDTIRIAIRHPDNHMSGMGMIKREQLFRWLIRGERGYGDHRIQVDIAVKYMVEERTFEAPKFLAVDATPHYVDYDIRMQDIYNAPYFRPLDDGKEIFLRKASVEEILQIALDKQEPEQAGIRARQRAESDREKFKRGGETKARLIMVA